MKKNKGLVDGGILLATYMIMVFTVTYIPILGTVILFFLPIPFILMSLRHNIKWSFILLIGSSFMALLLGMVFSIPMTIMFGLIGIVIGSYLRNDKNQLQMFIISVLIFIACTVIIFVITIAFFNVNFFEQSSIIMKESVEQSSAILSSMGQEEQAGELIEQMKLAFALFETLLPSIVVISAILFVGLVFLACKPIVNRLSKQKMTIARVRDIQLPKSLLWYYLFIMIGSLIFTFDEGTYSYTVVTNLLFLLQFFMLLQGYSFLFFLSYAKCWPKAVPVIITILSALLALTPFVRILGIIDLGFPFRKTMVAKGRE